MDNKMTKQEFNTYYEWVKSLEERITLLENDTQWVDKIIRTMGYSNYNIPFNYLEIRILVKLVTKEISRQTTEVQKHNDKTSVTKTMYDIALETIYSRLIKMEGDGQ